MVGHVGEVEAKTVAEAVALLAKRSVPLPTYEFGGA
jgi:hypothetical protein